MQQFVTLERAIACPQATVASAAETAAHALGQAGYRRGLGFGPTLSLLAITAGIYLVGAILIWRASGWSAQKTQGNRIYHEADRD